MLGVVWGLYAHATTVVSILGLRTPKRRRRPAEYVMHCVTNVFSQYVSNRFWSGPKICCPCLSVSQSIFHLSKRQCYKRCTETTWKLHVERFATKSVLRKYMKRIVKKWHSKFQHSLYFQRQNENFIWKHVFNFEATSRHEMIMKWVWMEYMEI